MLPECAAEKGDPVQLDALAVQKFDAAAVAHGAQLAQGGLAVALEILAVSCNHQRARPASCELAEQLLKVGVRGKANVAAQTHDFGRVRPSPKVAEVVFEVRP